ncbi:hypothetical protein [Natrinema sp. H-ect4]|uniref:hypothetical protein n=1 Tax=Natrinema sp. H-ect4 TaxID=3242699 RepID=UPI0035A84225
MQLRIGLREGVVEPVDRFLGRLRRRRPGRVLEFDAAVGQRRLFGGIERVKAPVVEQPVDGRTVGWELPEDTMKGEFVVDQRVPVAVDPLRPDEALLVGKVRGGAFDSKS